MEKEEFIRSRKALNEQIARLLPLIEEERAAYIETEYGRLQAIIGTGYWDDEMGRNEIFHGKMGDDLRLIEDRPRDPYDITVEELYWITEQRKHIERVGTDSYLKFFNMMPDDKKRIRFIAGLWHKLMHKTPCTEEEIRELEDGHQEFIDRKFRKAVTVIR